MSFDTTATLFEVSNYAYWDFIQHRLVLSYRSLYRQVVPKRRQLTTILHCLEERRSKCADLCNFNVLLTRAS
jgi:hypothetical protein